MNDVYSSVDMYYNICEIDFKKMRILEVFFKNWLDICFILFNFVLSLFFKIFDDKGIWIMVEFVNDYVLFWLISIGLNWLLNCLIKFVFKIVVEINKRGI